MFIDTHTHLNDARFKTDLPEVISRAHEAGIEEMIVVGYDLPSSYRAVEIAGTYPNCWAAVGIHPHDAGQEDAGLEKELEALLKNPKTVAMGEIGLDYHYQFASRERQQKIFRKQVTLAADLKIPVIIHDREAHADTWDILAPFLPGLAGGVLHCYSGGPDFAKRYIDAGFYLGFDGPVTFANARRTVDIIRKIPLTSILLETDCPYLAPHPFRGKRNEPSYIPLIAARIAEIKGVSLEEAGRVTSLNARRLFGF